MSLAKYTALSVAALAAMTATGNGTAIDVGEFHGKGKAILSHTLPGGTTPTWDFFIEHSEDGATGWTTLATFPQLTSASAAGIKVVEVDLDRAKRFVRLSRTAGGTSPTVTAGLAITGGKQKLP